MTLKRKIKAPKITTLFEIFLIVTILFFAFNIINAKAANYNDNNEIISLDYIVHDPIQIINNANFTDYGFPGLGLLGNPYIIENFNITDTVSGDTGILVMDTSVYFEIRNCYILTRIIGIKLENVLDGTAKIMNNTCRGYQGVCIYVIDADNTQIINNTCYSSYNGIAIDSSTSVDIYGNNCTGTGTGIDLEYSPSSNVINNTCIGNGAAGEFDDGILLRYSESSLLKNNTCDNFGRSGIYIYSSNTLTFINNTFTHNKHGIYGSTGGGEYTSNRFFYNENGAVISGTNTVRNNLCIGNNVGINGIDCYSSPIFNNSCYSNTIGIRVSGGNYGSIHDNICNGNLEYGIFIENSLPPFIGRNTCNDNGKSGIWINNISGITGGTVTENICSNNAYLGISIHHSEETEITDNICTNDGIGIFDGSVEDYLSYTVENNIVNGEPFGYIKNLNNSILFESSYKQFMVVNCHNLTIANNTLENVGIGINVVFCYNVTLANNTFMNSENYGLYLTASLNTTIIQNVFNDIYCGAYITSSYNTTAHMNWASNAVKAFDIYRSANVTLTNNILHDSGIFMNEDNTEAYLTYIVENNYVNGYPLGYITSMTSSTISGTVYGQLILVDCTDTTISNLDIDNTFSGLLLLYCDGLTIINNDFSNNYYGIYLLRTSNCVITENEINYNTVNGIFSSSSTYNLIIYNNFRENYEYSIFLERYGYDNVIHHNNFYDNNLAQIVSYLISQAFDGSETHSQNYWYDYVSQEGNYWSEAIDLSEYCIDGFDDARYDEYPLDTPAVPPIVSEFIGKNISITIVISMVLVLHITRKKRKNLKLKK